ncbi:unnamed protein product [Rhizophagus irregularis]|nr:unnamed protein product [Rhizophagus irregularis]
MQIWTSQATAAGLPLSNSILQLKGIEFAKLLNIEDQLKCTNGLIYSENNSDLSSDLSDDDHNTEGEVAESSHSAQNQKKSKKKPIKKKPDIKLTNIELVYLPPNTTAHLQPMDA